MPVITIKVLEGELTWGQTAEMVGDVTEAAVPFVGEVIRSNVWVLVEKVTPK
jgi:phenylpyruvate tautomerase PptA (4-oxalocrotonate tautomerase family)